MRSGRCAAFVLLGAQICAQSLGAFAAEKEVEITIGLTCARVGRETAKWDELEGTGGFLDAPWYTGEKETKAWVEDSANKPSRLWSEKYFSKTNATWTRFTSYVDKETRPGVTMPRHHRYDSVGVGGFTWTDSYESHFWGRYLGDCDSPEGGIPISTVPSSSVMALAKGINIDMDNNPRNNFILASNALPRASSATGGRATQEYQNQLADVIWDSIPPLPPFSEVANTERTDGQIKLKDKADGREKNSKVWLQGFGGNSSPFSYEMTSQGSFGNWKSSYGGYVVGVSFEASSSLWIGPFLNWGNIGITFLDEGSGSWNPSGYGGGLAASYSKGVFYLKGLLGITAFKGVHLRGLVPVGDFAGGEASGDKRTTSYVASVKAGFPLQVGWLHYEPQLAGTWNRNHDLAWEESGGGVFNLNYDAYDDNFLRTNLALRVSTPIRVSKVSKLNPFARIGWLADWDLKNPSLYVTNASNGNSAEIPIKQQQENGLLLEGGINYSISSSPTSVVEIYAKGGIEKWDAVQKVTNWRTSGGLTVTF